MPVFRSTNPAELQAVWEAIRMANHQRQAADSCRLGKMVARILSVSQDEAEEVIDKCYKDSLLVQVTGVGVRGRKRGVESQTYKIPSDIQSLPTHDWYCYECHLSGNVIACEGCHRVFHKTCIKTNMGFMNNIKTTNKEALKRVNGVKKDIQVQNGINGDSDQENKKQNGTSDNKNESDDKKATEDLEDEFASNHASIDTHCYICRLADLERLSGGLVDCTFKELNYLLQFTYNRICTWLPDESLSDMIPSTKNEITVNDEAWCALFLIRGYPMTFRKIQDKLKRGAYESLTGFCSDVSDIVHHVGILYGNSSDRSDAAKYMLNDCMFDLAEIRQCRDCYRHSNEKNNALWFAKPCNPRHELVYAKQKGYCYWPAKVIKITPEGSYDVRFFGSRHFRAVIDPQFVKPVDTSFQDLQLLKRSQSLNKAIDELVKHQKLLTKPIEQFSFIAESQKKKLSESTMPDDSETDVDIVPISKKRKVHRKDKANANSVNNKLIPTVKLTRTLEGLTNFAANKPKPRMTRNSLVTATDMTVYDISTNDADRDMSTSSDDERSKKKKKIKRNKRSVNKEEMMKGKRSCGLKNDESAQVEVIKLCISSDDEENVNNMKTIDFIGETSAKGKNASNKTKESSPLDQASQGGGVSRRKNFDKIKLKVEQAASLKDAARIAHEALMKENERWEAELQTMVDEQVKSLLMEVKRRQWCFYCGDEAIYHCCWNTAYCSTTCQQQHWQSEHKRNCRRKR